MKKWLPWILTGIFAAWFLSGTLPPKPKNGFHVAAWGRLPVLLNGRVQPLDSVARNSLLGISGTSELANAGGGPMSATEWLLEAMTKPELADQRKIFRVQHPDLAGKLGATTEGLQKFSFNDLTNQYQYIKDQAQNIFEAENGKGEEAEKQRTALQKDVLHLFSSLQLYFRIKNSLEPEGADDFQKEVEAYQQSLPAGRAALQNTEEGKPANAEDVQRITVSFRRYEQLSQIAYVWLIPPAPGQPRQAWSNTGTNLMDAVVSGAVGEPMKDYARMAGAYQANQPGEFNQAVADYRVWLQSNELASALGAGEREFFFNQIQPFYVSMVIYVAAVILGCLYWINLSPALRKSGFYLLVLAFAVHTFALLFRMYLQGRPPVTNLYSSAIFIGWAAVLFGIFLERIFLGGIGLVCTGFIGFITLNIAHHLALQDLWTSAGRGDTMEMLRAVLDTNLWLSTHVVVVTLGYASMFVAGLLAIVYIVRGFFTRTLAPEMGKTLARMVYGIVCFATLFSFVGTILGGIWADQSWGRFWGWDPKENGALLIVLWNGMILHARWGGLIKERGLMAMAVFGNIVTSFSWFGVNMLGIGLHSYGFMDAAFRWLMFFDATQVALIVLALTPARHWASFKAAAAPAGPPPAPAAASI
ncbi:MAG: cytochrome c biogenesis protein CcsA [Verrucomicrobiota bacterium]|jgi:ABC-type transport system involved in cytochrome c biogenesis permease subunit